MSYSEPLTTLPGHECRREFEANGLTLDKKKAQGIRIWQRNVG